MKVIEVSERSTVDIPLSELLHVGGRLKIRPDLIGKGLVEIFQSQNTLKLRVNGLIGRLPVTEDLALDIQPKFPVSNLNRMVYASRSALRDPFNFTRPYEKFRTREYLPVPLIKTLCRNLERLVVRGIHRSYKRELIIGSPKPRIDFMKSHQKFWAKLDPTQAVIERFDFTQDNVPNRFLKLAASKSLALARTSSHLSDCVPILAESLRQLERVTLVNQRDLSTELSYVHTFLPAERYDYHSALSAAVEIIQHIDVSLNTTSEGLALESYIISMDDVFEQYIRSIISNFKDGSNRRIATVDGNKPRHQKKLFFDNKKYPTKPDIIIKHKSTILVTGDVKYKDKPRETDRYQVISDAMAYNVKTAIIFYPKSPLGKITGLSSLGHIGSEKHNIHVLEYFFDLSGDLESQEIALRKAIQALCEHHS